MLVVEYVTRSDEIGLIAMFLLSNDYSNSVSFSKISINFYISDEKVVNSTHKVIKFQTLKLWSKFDGL